MEVVVSSGEDGLHPIPGDPPVLVDLPAECVYHLRRPDTTMSGGPTELIHRDGRRYRNHRRGSETIGLEAREVAGRYGKGPLLFSGVDLTLERGQVLGLPGPSGAGKTTLARTLALMTPPAAGRVVLGGRTATATLFGVPRDLRAGVAMIFQSARQASDPRLTLRRTISQPARARGLPVDVPALADRVGLSPDLLGRRPHEVSGGQLQRACIARALAQRPHYLVCDEPAAMFDSATTATVMRLTQSLAADEGLGVLVVSHDRAVLRATSDHVLEWRDLVTPVAGSSLAVDRRG